METYTIKDHPQKGNVEGLPLDQFRNLKKACEAAVSSWKKDTKSSPEEKEYNINYFSVYLEMVNNRINKLTKSENK